MNDTKKKDAGPEDLVAYVRKRLDGGAEKMTIRDELKAVGWSEDNADAVYARALVASGVPVPTSASSGVYSQRASTLYTVLNLFSFLLLGATVAALGTVYFQIINYFFPDPLYARSFLDSVILYAIAALIVAFPLYFLTVRMWFKRFWEETGTVESRLTQWVTYLVLMVAAITIVGDLIAVIYTFLEGELNIRFFLKTLTIFGIAGTVFGFYYLERKKVQYQQDVPEKKFRLFGYAVSGVVLIGVVLGLFTAGLPGYQRDRAFDEQRSNGLAQIAGCVSGFAQEFERLPVDFNEMTRQPMYQHCADVRDPKTGEAYDYQVVKDVATSPEGRLEGEFELCANFALSASSADPRSYPVDPYGGAYPYAGAQWSEHDAGYVCKTHVVSFKPQVQVTLPAPMKR